MASLWLPEFEGRFPENGVAGTPPKEILNRIADRVSSRTLLLGVPARTRYTVTEHNDYRLRFQAENWMTAISVGLNEVTLESDTEGGLRYHVTFYRWLKYCMALSLPTPILLAVVFCVLQATEPSSIARMGVYLPWALIGVFFISGAWPFVLAMGHKPVARRVLQRCLINAAAGDIAAPDMSQGVDYRSSIQLFGLPLVHVCIRPNRGGERGVAKGIIAVGDVAMGVLAVGGAAVGGIAVGGISVGLVAVGGCAIGAVALGGVAIGGVVFGGVAIGGVAAGGVAIGAKAAGGVAIGHSATGGVRLGPR